VTRIVVKLFIFLSSLPNLRIIEGPLTFPPAATVRIVVGPSTSVIINCTYIFHDSRQELHDHQSDLCRSKSSTERPLGEDEDYEAKNMLFPGKGIEERYDSFRSIIGGQVMVMAGARRPS
jgi:hypothetical protein